MKTEITSRNKAPLLNREEVKATISFEGGVPSRKDVRKSVADVAKAKPELVVVRRIDSYFGDTRADVHAFIYKDEGSLKGAEKPYMIDRHGEKKKEASPVPAEEAKEEPAEEAEAPPAENTEGADTKE